VDRSFFKDFTTPRLVLKNISIEDTDFILNEFSNPDVTKYLFDADPFQTPDEAREMIDWYNNDFLDHNRWVIFNKETGLHLGTCGFHNWNIRDNRADIGYDLLPEYWGKGYMSEALPKAIEFAFDTMNLHRICAITYTENTSSMKLLARMGFQKEGLLRGHHFFQGKYYDHFLFTLIKGIGSR
jgi:ribosomal-protein-alanine N-acetyltransferase